MKLASVGLRGSFYKGGMRNGGLEENNDAAID
jgi:hypothetical protein